MNDYNLRARVKNSNPHLLDNMTTVYTRIQDTTDTETGKYTDIQVRISLKGLYVQFLGRPFYSTHLHARYMISHMNIDTQSRFHAKGCHWWIFREWVASSGQLDTVVGDRCESCACALFAFQVSHGSLPPNAKALILPATISQGMHRKQSHPTR
jgi:hypothetical protein